MSVLEDYIASFDGEPGYLDWAAFGPLSPTVRGEVHADAELLGSGRRSSIELVADHARQARESVADLIGSSAEQVVLQPSTSYGLTQVMYGLHGGLVASRAEFPSITVAATRAFEALGRIGLQWIEPPHGFVTPEVVRDALTDDTRAVAVSLVDFRTGFHADLDGIRDVIGDRLLIVNAIQGFGVVDVDYRVADVVCSNGYKWLRAGRGTGFAWFSERALERLSPVLSGYVGVEGPLSLDSVGRPDPSAAAFTVSVPDHLAAARLSSALAEIRTVGVSAIQAELAERTREVVALADQFDVPVATPREPERHAGIVALEPAANDAAPLAAALANHGLAVTTRSGLVRIAPHVGTGEHTLRMLGDALAEYSTARVW